jgi:hypothetical protein
MGYCTPELVQRILVQSLTSATSPTTTGKGSLINFGQGLDKNLITDEIMNQHINVADVFINSVISGMYKTPLKEIADLECKLAVDIDSYCSDVILISPQANVFVPGDVIVISDGTYEEKKIVSSITGDNVLNFSSAVEGIFSADLSRVLRVRFPDPIPNTSARLAAASIYDRYFSSQSTSQQSEFAKNLKNLARVDLNNIVNGRAILHGQHRIGDRFVNSHLRDRYNMRAGDSDSTRDIGEL